jgi:jasmonate ZIM domain-containing protein
MLASRASVPGATPSSEPDSPPVPAPAPAKVNVAEVFPGARQIAVQKPEPCVPHLSSAATASPVRIVVPQAVAPSRSTSHCATEACGSKPAAAPTSQTVSSSRQLAAASAAAAVTPRGTTYIHTSRSLASAETVRATRLIYPCFVCLFVLAVPQARKASLARFLEKRKERYGLCLGILSMVYMLCSSLLSSTSDRSLRQDTSLHPPCFSPQSG